MSARGLYPTLGIGDATRLFGLTPRALRFYEEEGLILSVRDRQNCRRYDEAARRALELIAQLRRAGLTIREIRDLLGAQRAGEDMHPQARVLLAAQRAALTRQLADLESVETWLDKCTPPGRLARAS